MPTRSVKLDVDAEDTLTEFGGGLPLGIGTLHVDVLLPTFENLWVAVHLVPHLVFNDLLHADLEGKEVAQVPGVLVAILVSRCVRHSLLFCLVVCTLAEKAAFQ